MAFPLSLNKARIDRSIAGQASVGPPVKRGTVPRSLGEVKCSAATPANKSVIRRCAFFSRLVRRFKLWGGPKRNGAKDANHQGRCSDGRGGPVGVFAGPCRYGHAVSG